MKVASPPPKVAAGDRFTFQLELEWPNSEGPYEIQSGDPLFENLTLRHQRQSEETSPGKTRITITLELEAIKAGEGRILPFEVRYRKAGTEPWQSLPVIAQKIQVSRAFPWKTFKPVFLILMGSAVAIGGTVAFLKFRKETERRKSICPPDPKQRAYAHADEAITTYKGETQQETLNHWANQIKQVIMTYYDIPPKTAATGAEVLAVLKSRALPAGEFAEIGRLFREIEQLKFAPRTLPIREMEALQKTLLQYIRGKIIIENSTNG